jgi:hypothetical protein
MSTAQPGDEDNLKLLGAIPASARGISAGAAAVWAMRVLSAFIRARTWAPWAMPAR